MGSEKSQRLPGATGYKSNATLSSLPLKQFQELILLFLKHALEPSLPKKVLIYTSRYNSHMGHWLTYTDLCTYTVTESSSMAALTRWVILTWTLHRQFEILPNPCSQYILESSTFPLGREMFLKWKGKLPFIWMWGKDNWQKIHCLKSLHSKRSSLLYFHIAKRPSQVISFFK